MNSDEQRRLLRRIRWLVGLFIAGLVVSGATAIPLESEAAWLTRVTGAREMVVETNPGATPAWAAWLCRVEDALREINRKHPFIAYGGDWLAFGHFIIALAFVWAWREPVRNRWLFDFGLITCALVIPWALVFGELRGIPFWWRLIDCSFGLLGALPLWLARRAARRLDEAANTGAS